MSLMQPGSKFIIRLVSEEYTNNRIDYPKRHGALYCHWVRSRWVSNLEFEKIKTYPTWIILVDNPFLRLPRRRRWRFIAMKI